MTDIVPEALSDDAALAYTQQMRQRIVQEIAGTAIPKDADTQKLLLTILDGMDRNALGTKRLQVEDRNSDADRKAALLIAEMQTQLGIVNPFQFGVLGGTTPSHPDRLVDDFTIVPGELDDAPITSNFKDFTAKDV